jgi:hypothetical protein
MEVAEQVKTTIMHLVQAEPGLVALAAMPLPIKVAYRVAKLMRLVEVETKEFHVFRSAQIKELGKPKEPTAEDIAAGRTTDLWQLSPEALATFNARMTELGDMPVTIAWSALKVSDFGDINVAAKTLMDLGPLLDMEG